MEVLLSAPPVQEAPETDVTSSRAAELVTTGKRWLGRSALVLSLVAGAGATIFEPNPDVAVAATFTNTYPNADAHPYNVANYDWSVDEDGDGLYEGGGELLSARGYGYRNCTDGVAYWVSQYIPGVTIPTSWGNGNTWDTNASNANYTVKAGNTNSIEPGDIAQSDDGSVGHVGLVTAVNKDGNGNVTSIQTAELNAAGDGNYTAPTYASKNASGKFIRPGTNRDWDNFIDLNGAGKGLNNETLSGGGPPPLDPLAISFVRLNHPSGNVGVDSYSEASNYQQLTESTLAGYPSVPGDGSVVPLFQRDGDLSLVRLNHPSGHVEVVTYSEASGYHDMIGYSLTGYPAVPGDGNVVPLYQYDGDLSFIRLNHSSGHVEEVAYSEASNFQTLTESKLTNYPSVPGDGNVVPMYWLNDDLVFVRLNHSSGHVELASYSKGSNYTQLANYQLLPYPSVPGDGAVVPMFQPVDGDLSFIRLNHSSGHVEVVTYGVGTGFQQINDYDYVSYPAVPPDGNVVPLYSN